ncbi:MAG: polyketide synthase [Planctomycetes bacterium]|nr:polyketide synthase [Planctomycetota bacterium]
MGGFMDRDGGEVDGTGALRKATLALQKMRAKLDALERARREPIAIVGVACRFPAGANDVESCWRLLSEGWDGTREVPADRWDVDSFYDPTPGVPGKAYTRRGGFLDSVDQFDPQFFRISPREALTLDPQQRLLLEVSWEALDNAGQRADLLSGSDTGVFLGISTSDYAQILSKSAHSSSNNAQAGLNAPSVASGRISYTFGFQGPCMAIDTACSSSMVATHLAIQALRNAECRMALVAGVNLMLSPEITINFSQGPMLSPDGRCKTFDAAADGYARGEGCGVLVLKRLAHALSDSGVRRGRGRPGPRGTLPRGPCRAEARRRRRVPPAVRLGGDPGGRAGRGSHRGDGPRPRRLFRALAGARSTSRRGGGERPPRPRRVRRGREPLDGRGPPRSMRDRGPLFPVARAGARRPRAGGAPRARRRRPSAEVYLADETPAIYARLFQFSHPIVREAMRAAVRGQSGARIPEVGGGLGSTAREVLPVARSEGASYLFTDVS